MDKLKLSKDVLTQLVALSEEDIFIEGNILKLIDTEGLTPDERKVIEASLINFKQRAGRSKKNQQDILKANEKLEVNKIELGESLIELTEAKEISETAKIEAEFARSLAEDEKLIVEQHKDIIEQRERELQSLADNLQKDNQEKAAFILKAKESDNNFFLRKWAMIIIAVILLLFFIADPIQLGMLSVIQQLFPQNIPDNLIPLVDKIISNNAYKDASLLVLGGLLAFVTQQAIKSSQESVVKQAYTKPDGTTAWRENKIINSIETSPISNNPPPLDEESSDKGKKIVDI